MMVWVIALFVIMAAIPPKYDPAIRWKERNERKKLEKTGAGQRD